MIAVNMKFVVQLLLPSIALQLFHRMFSAFKEWASASKNNWKFDNIVSFYSKQRTKLSILLLFVCQTWKVLELSAVHKLHDPNYGVLLLIGRGFQWLPSRVRFVGDVFRNLIDHAVWSELIFALRGMQVFASGRRLALAPSSSNKLAVPKFAMQLPMPPFSISS